MAEFAQRVPGEPDVGSREDWDIIEQALGFKDFDPQRRRLLWGRLQTIVSLYYGWGPPGRVHEPLAQVDKVRPAHSKAALGVLKNHATRLRLYLGAEPEEPWPTDELGELDGWALGVFLRDHYLMMSKRNRSALTNRLTELIGLIDNTRQSLSEDKGGRPRDFKLHPVIYHLADLYREHTGEAPGISLDPIKRQYHGPFLRLVKTVLKVYAPDQLKADSALAGDIRRVLEWWKRDRLGMNKTSK
jgi:hypothetical protein